MAETLTEVYSDADISVNIIWIPMVATDDEAAARKLSSLFPDARVRQFWDADRRCGTVYTQHVFQGWARQAFSGIAEEERSRETLYVRADEPSVQRPAWDMVLFYGSSVEWGDHPPMPVHWVCQHAFYGPREDGTSGRFWRNDFGKEPFASDWLVEVSHGMTVLIGERPADPDGHEDK